MMKNTIDNAIAIAMKTGVVAVGAVRRVHVTEPLSFEREQDPVVEQLGLTQSDGD